MKKRTSNLLGLIALAALAVGVVGLASGGFKDWSAFTKAKDNAASVIGGRGSTTSNSSEIPMNIGNGIEISADTYAFEGEGDTISIAVLVSDALLDKSVRLSLTWDGSLSHSSGDPLDYVALSGQTLASRTTMATATCLTPFAGRINVIAVNSEGLAAMIRLKSDVQWELTYAAPLPTVLNGTPISSWANKTFEGKNYAPANAVLRTVNGEPGMLFTVNDSSWFVLRVSLAKATGIDQTMVPDDLSAYFGEEIVDDPFEITAAKATGLMNELGVGSYFKTYGGIVDGLEWEKENLDGEVVTNNRRIHWVYLACSMANSELAAGEVKMVSDMPWTYRNTLEETATNIQIRHVS